MIRITSKYNGFIRCGVHHPSTTTEYDDDHFTKEEMEILQAEPMLMVRRVEAVDDDHVLELVNGTAPWSEKDFRALNFDEAKEIANAYYGVTGRSWDGLWKDFSTAQGKHFAGSKV